MGESMHRRQWLLQALGWSMLPAFPLAASAQIRADNSTLPRFIAAWQASGQQHIGQLAWSSATASKPQLRPLHTLEVPTRAHALLQEPSGAIVSVARRPGDWLVRWHPGQEPQWLWIEADRVFNGHVLASADGRHIYTTETDLADSQGLIGVRDARSLEKVAEWRTGGMDPHQLLLDGDGSLIVANGGIPTQPETGRRKLRLDHMDSSVVRLAPQSQGETLGLWKLDDPRLSLRHLAWGKALRPGAARRWLGVALQAEHDDAEAKRQAPVLAVFDGEALRAVPAPQALNGYGGDIAFTGRGFAVSCPRVDGVALFGPGAPGAQIAWQGLHALPGAYALAASPTGPQLWVGGGDQAEGLDAAGQLASLAPAELGTIQLDNHWLRAQHG
ncbi:DUF1513 domain-containing protein [Comamonas endophytica]|uniref:DUF1513 domain-containing protein n=1 Tax=Comamonas endophytica TaxID=2949090 RepID=A0ABY6G8Y0_9BURK|nr:MULTISPECIES: DUF1513 domain-containing protein [unclassified Acidovorax]MCD2511785.1 DUF1513 domain-containing protein [Acidovorax sp. D4N7]UYG51509.1 DUF1513 domain-containing protein [Acidovorax sp. 5MLIR]